jgi:glycerol uptake facilitator-like aquaporin
MIEPVAPLLRRLLAEFLGSAFLAAVVIILMFGPVSGGHFNPAVSLVNVHFGGIGWRDAIAYLPAQIGGCILGAVLANGMFAKAAISISAHRRASPGHLLGEMIATCGLILVIFALARSKRSTITPAAVGAYVGAAYFFTSSTNFANPAIAVGRMFSDTFAGIAPASVPGFKLLGAVIAAALIRVLYPEIQPADAAAVVVPHPS